MQYRKLGNTGIDVSAICLGTMTWDEQNSQTEAFKQMDYTLSQGVNFFDTAELYPIPPQAKTYARTGEIIGNWLHKSGNRNRIILASKIAGPGPGGVDHIRNGRTRFNRKHLEAAPVSPSTCMIGYCNLRNRSVCLGKITPHHAYFEEQNLPCNRRGDHTQHIHI